MEDNAILACLNHINIGKNLSYAKIESALKFLSELST